MHGRMSPFPSFSRETRAQRKRLGVEPEGRGEQKGKEGRERGREGQRAEDGGRY